MPRAVGAWMLLVERSPWPRPTLVVSLEAIFLSAFVLIGQNRQAAFARAKADHDFRAQAEELRVNTALTRALYQRLEGAEGGVATGAPASPAAGVVEDLRPSAAPVPGS